MDKSELFRFRAEDFAARLRQLQDAEWKIAFQVFAAYAALGVAFYKGLNASPHKLLIALFASITLIVLFLIHLYIRLRYHERQRCYQNLMIEYLKALHTEVGAPEIPIPELPDSGTYAFGAQMVVSLGMALCISFFIVLKAIQ